MTDNEVLAKRIYDRLKDDIENSTWHDSHAQACYDLFGYGKNTGYERDIIGSILDVLNEPETKTVRVCRPYGPCEVLGTFVKKTAQSYIYTDDHGEQRRKGIDSLPRAAGYPKPAPHIEPCVNCSDHPDSRYGPGRCSIHGNQVPCETCMST